MIKHWRTNGIKIVIFIDDGIGAAGSSFKCKAASNFVRRSIGLSGFLSNEEKSEWEPKQLAIWLGLEINTKDFALKIKDKRILKIMDKMEKMYQKECASAREISSIAGGLISQSIVMGSVTGLFTREMYHFIANCPTWDRKVEIPTGIYMELVFWQENLSSLNCKYLDNLSVPVCASVNSDASSVACGAILKIDESIYTAHQNFSPDEIDQSSTWRELKAVLFSLRSFIPKLRNRYVNWETDNQAVPSITSKGSKKPHLQQIAVQIFNVCKQNNVNLNINWIPREENIIADEISKFIDYDDWRTTHEFFQYLEQKWGPFTIDRFANEKNSHTRRYNALFWNPNCEAVDAFTQDWSRETNWVVPPVFLIATVLQHARACKSSGTMITPLWESAPFWPMITKTDGTFKKFVHDYEIFTVTSGILELGDFKQSLLGSTRFRAPIIAFKFKF